MLCVPLNFDGHEAECARLAVTQITQHQTNNLLLARLEFTKRWERSFVSQFEIANDY